MLLVWPPGADFDERAQHLYVERAGFAAEFGEPVEVVRADPGHGRRWVFRVDPEHHGEPEIRTSGEAIESVGATADDVWRTLSWRHTWLRLGRPATLCMAPVGTIADAVDRIVAEVGFSYPSFDLHGLDWDALCAEHGPRVRDAVDPVAAMQRWVANLTDAHTALRPTNAAVPLPYVGRVDGETLTLLRVPETSAAHAVGARPGWRIIEPSIEDELDRTPATVHMRPYLAARRILSGPPGLPMELRAHGPNGETASWRETPAWVPTDGVASWRRIEPDVGYLAVRTWLGGNGLPELFDAALTELADCPALVLDLRGNVGGNYLLALSTRDRFVRPGIHLGSVRHSIGNQLSDPVPIVSGDTDRVRWPGRLVVLTDPLTYSASEDFLLGLQGLDHVHVVGECSGGGSGRPRAIPLLPDWSLLVSTVLTYDRTGRCIEGSGIPVDHPVPVVLPHEDRALATAITLAR